MNRRVRFAVLALTLASSVLVACGDSDDDADAAAGSTPTQASEANEPVERKMVRVPDATVGRLGDDTNALVAVVPGDGNISVYICDEDGRGEGGELSSWFRGSWDNTGPAELRRRSMRLTVSPGANGSFSGELVTATGEVLPFTAAPATDEDDGLFRVEQYKASTGEVEASGDTIVFNGDERGVIVPVTTRCRLVKKTVVRADGTSDTVIVQVCG